MDRKSLILFFYLSLNFCYSVSLDVESPQPSDESKLYKIDGRVTAVHLKTASGEIDRSWLKDTRVLVDGGKFIAFPKEDGYFTIEHVPSGSYILQVLHPSLTFLSTRVEISAQGKYRAREVNHVMPNEVVRKSYPLQISAQSKASYFTVREPWRITDLLMNPMVIMMLLPLVFVFLIPKLAQADPEAQKELNSQFSALTSPKNTMPDLTESVMKMFGSPAPQSNQKKSEQQQGSSSSRKKIKKQQ